MDKIQKRVYEIIEKTKDDDKASAICSWSLIILICLNIAAVICSSLDNVYNRYNKAFTFFEYFSIAIFTIEYLLRLWTAPCKYSPSQKKPVILSYIHFIFFSLGIFDLCAILPFYLPFVFIDLRALRILRLFRLLRIFKLARYNKSFDVIGRVLKNEKDKLFTTIFIIGVMLLLASSVMYTVENSVQPEAFHNIPATLWWAVVTLSTVGYGDVYPITALGKLLSGIISILGIILIALPSGIIASGFVKEYDKEKEEQASTTDIYNVLKLLETNWKLIDKMAEIIINQYCDFTMGKREINKNAQGIRLDYKKENKKEWIIFCGLSPSLADKENGKYVYSLAIYTKSIKPELKDTVKIKYEDDDGWIYIPIKKELFSHESQEKKLKERVIEIIKEDFLRICEE